jgi:hypothetical protein
MEMSPFSNETDVRATLAQHVGQTDADTLVTLIHERFRTEIARGMRIGHGMYNYLRPDVRLVRVQRKAWITDAIPGWRTLDMYTADGSAQLCIGLIDDNLGHYGWSDL